MALPPYPRQGTRLLTSTGFDGEWIIFGEVFLFKTDPPGARGKFDGLMRPDGIEIDGFDAHDLAGELGITAEDLFEFNQKNLLMVEYRRVPTVRGADWTTEYDIRTPTTGIRQWIGQAAIKGKA